MLNYWHGGMGEWLKPAVLKTVILLTRDRGFESLSLRHSFDGAQQRAEAFRDCDTKS